MEGIERLQLEVLEMNNFSVLNVFNYIKNKTELQEKFNNKEKTIKGMYSYICKKAEKLKQGKVAMVNNEVVYLWAINYFKYTNEELGIKEDEKETNTVKMVGNEESKSKKEEISNKDENSQISLFEEVQD